MRVGVDATIWPNRRGFGRFSRNLITRLVALDAGTEFVLVGDGPPPEAPEPPPGTSWRAVTIRRPASELVTSSGMRPFTDLLRLSRTVRRNRFDAFVFPCIDTYYPVGGTPTVVGLYDAISDEFAHAMLPQRRARFLWRMKQAAAVRGATQVFTISEASRTTLSRRLGIDPARLPVLRGAPDPSFFPRSRDDVRREQTRLGLADRPYILYAGGIGPHKGLETLLDAYGALASADPDAPTLVVVGEFDAPSYEAVTAPVRARAGALPAPADVRFTGWVDDDLLACLHGGAAAVAVTSRAEGFGLPAVEAAACGASLVLSNIAPHRETLRNAALMFPPGDSPALTARLRELLDQPALRTRLGHEARKAAGRLSWDASAYRLRDLVHEAAAGRGAGRASG